MKEKSYSQGLGRHTHEDRKWSKRLLMAVTAVSLLSNPLSAQSNASKQPLPTFKYRADNTTDTARQYKVIPNKETKAVSVCAVWNLTDTAERTLWSMADSSGKVAASCTTASMKMLIAVFPNCQLVLSMASCNGPFTGSSLKMSRATRSESSVCLA